jgi:hypothetical protein
MSFLFLIVQIAPPPILVRHRHHQRISTPKQSRGFFGDGWDYSGFVGSSVDTPQSSSSSSSSSSFRFSATSTPTVTKVSPPRAMPGQVVSIFGKHLAAGAALLDTNWYMSEFGFYSQPETASVVVGASPCSPLLFHNDTLIQCRVLIGPMGIAMPVKVNVHGKGVAALPQGDQEADGTFTFAVDVNALSPAAGSLAGGTTVTVDTSRLHQEEVQGFEVTTFTAWMLDKDPNNITVAGSEVEEDDFYYSDASASSSSSSVSEVRRQLQASKNKNKDKLHRQRQQKQQQQIRQIQEQTLPHGLLPQRLSETSQAVHDAVTALLLQAPLSSASSLLLAGAGDDDDNHACVTRLAHLRHLVRTGDLKAAFDLSFALGYDGEEEHTTNTGGEDKEDGSTTTTNLRHRFAHPACHADKPHVGEGSISSTIKTPVDRRVRSAKSLVSSFIELHTNDAADAASSTTKKDTESDSPPPTMQLPLRRVVTESDATEGRNSQASTRRGTGVREAVVGFELDGEFIVADSPLRCRARRSIGEDGDYAAFVDAALSAHASSAGLECDGGESVSKRFHANGHDAMASFAESLLNHPTASSRRNHRKLSTTFMQEPIETEGPNGYEIAAAAFYGTDVENRYARGTPQRMLVMPICPSDSPNCLTADKPFGYCYGKIGALHGCTEEGIVEYFTKVMRTNSDFYETGSWGELSYFGKGLSSSGGPPVEPTILPPMPVAYQGGSCQNYNALSGDVPDAGSFDGMAINAAKARGFSHLNYDMWLVFIPGCPLEFSGVGKLGKPGSLLNLLSPSYDASVAHELGHNYGANHASVMDGASRGAVAWVDDPEGFVEYGNPHSTMGNGDLEYFQADFMLPLKLVFDWVGDRDIWRATPFDEVGVGGCDSGCGPLKIGPGDSGSRTEGVRIGVQIATATPGRFYFVEHRTSSTFGSAALVSWTDLSGKGSGGTGMAGFTYLADCTPLTPDWGDAGCLPGSHLVLDVGNPGFSMKLLLLFGSLLSDDGSLEVTLSTSAETIALLESGAVQATVLHDLQTTSSVTLVTAAADARVFKTPLAVPGEVTLNTWLLAKLESGIQHGSYELYSACGGGNTGSQEGEGCAFEYRADHTPVLNLDEAKSNLFLADHPEYDEFGDDSERRRRLRMADGPQDRDPSSSDELKLPHGLLPAPLSEESLMVHTAVVESTLLRSLPYLLMQKGDDSSSTSRIHENNESDSDNQAAAVDAATASACEARLNHLRHLVRTGDLKAAFDLSFALGYDGEEEHTTNMGGEDKEDGSTTTTNLRHRFAHPACHADKPHVGEGSISSTIKTPVDRTQDGASPEHAAFIELHHIIPDLHMSSDTKSIKSKSKTLLPLRRTLESTSPQRGTGVREAVVGFELDGEFIVADSPLRCRSRRSISEDGGYAAFVEAALSAHASSAGLECDGGESVSKRFHANGHDAMTSFAESLALATAEAGRRLGTTFMGKPLLPSKNMEGGGVDSSNDDNDAVQGLSGEVDNTYVVGTKSVLVLPICPSDSPNCLTADKPFGYCYGLMQTDHGCASDGSSVTSYLKQVMETNSNFFEVGSWGQLSFNATVAPVLQVDYLGASCGNYQALTNGYFEGLDGMAFAAAADLLPRSYDVEAYDHWLVFMPGCSELGYSGIGWVGKPGSLLNLVNPSYDDSGTC